MNGSHKMLNVASELFHTDCILRHRSRNAASLLVVCCPCQLVASWPRQFYLHTCAC